MNTKTILFIFLGIVVVFSNSQLQSVNPGSLEGFCLETRLLKNRISKCYERALARPVVDAYKRDLDHPRKLKEKLVDYVLHLLREEERPWNLILTWLLEFFDVSGDGRFNEFEIGTRLSQLLMGTKYARDARSLARMIWRKTFRHFDRNHDGWLEIYSEGLRLGDKVKHDIIRAIDKNARVHSSGLNFDEENVTFDANELIDFYAIKVPRTIRRYAEREEKEVPRDMRRDAERYAKQGYKLGRHYERTAKQVGVNLANIFIWDKTYFYNTALTAFNLLDINGDLEVRPAELTGWLFRQLRAFGLRIPRQLKKCQYLLSDQFRRENHGRESITIGEWYRNAQRLRRRMLRYLRRRGSIPI